MEHERTSPYWYRVSRRAVIRGIGAATAGLGGMALFGCSSDDATSTATPQVVSAGSTPAAGAAAAAGFGKGGTLRVNTTADADNLDPHKTVGFRGISISVFTYDRLWRYKTSSSGLADGSVEGALIESRETPDPLTITGKIRPTAKWDPRAPTNGRAVTAEDVVLSWNAHDEFQARRVDLSNRANPAAPVAKVEAIDAQTVRITLAQPDATVFERFCQGFGSLYVLPKEARNGGYDPAVAMRGSGPWILDEYKTSVGFKFSRNPSYWDKEHPFADNVDMPIVGAAAQVEAQFKAQQIHVGGVGATNMLAIAREMGDRAKIVLTAPGTSMRVYGFGYQPGSPFHDVRVRRALSMLLDRDALGNTFYEPKKFVDGGIKMQAYTTAGLTPSYGPLFLDPKSSKFGDEAKYLKQNVTEAKTLLRAAGQEALKFPITTLSGTEYGATFNDWVEAVTAMFSAGGVTASINAVDFTTVYNTKYARGKSNYEGMFAIAGSGRGIPETHLAYHFDPGGVASVVGGGDIGGAKGVYPPLLEMMQKSASTLDPAARQELWHRIQRYIASEVPALLPDGLSDGVLLANTGVHGVSEYSTYQSASVLFPAEQYPYLSLAPRLRA